MVRAIVKDISVDFDIYGSDSRPRNEDLSGIGSWIAVEYGGFHFKFDLSGRLKSVNADSGIWPNSWDRFERTQANDWIFFEYEDMGIADASIGDHYIPFNGRTDLPLSSRGEFTPQLRQDVFDTFERLLQRMDVLQRDKPDFTHISPNDLDSTKDRVWRFFEQTSKKDLSWLKKDAQRLYEIVGGEILVLPPDTRRVEYNGAQIFLTDGCPYDCNFCKSGGNSQFRIRDESSIDAQIPALVEYYGAELHNLDSVILCQNDVFPAGARMIGYAANKSYTDFRLADSYMRHSYLFMFATLRSFLTEDDIIDTLEQLPFTFVYVNIGLEAATQKHLDQLEKPQTVSEVVSGLRKAADINRRSKKVKVSANFLLSDHLGIDHRRGINSAIKNGNYYGELYFSPILGQSTANIVLPEYNRIRRTNPNIVCHLYTIQRGVHDQAD